MFTKSITTRITDKLAVAAEVEKHKIEAAKTFSHPKLVGTQVGSPADDDTDGLTVLSIWEDGPEPEA